METLPTHKDRGWEFTDLSLFTWDNYPEAAQTEAEADFTNVRAVLQPRRGIAVSTVDGQLREIPEPPAGVKIMALADNGVAVAPQLGRLVQPRDAFTRFNAAHARDGVAVHVAANTIADEPIVISHLQTQAHTTASTRALIVVEAGASAIVVEQLLSSDPELDACMIPVTEIVLGEGASLKYLCAQTLSTQTWLFGSQRAELARDANLHWVGLGLGSRKGKMRMETDLRGQGSRAVVTGAYVAEGQQHLDYETTQEHYAANTSSDLSFRGILRDRARAVWSGMIRVDPGAQKTDAFQESRNLLLSAEAHADSIPGLEIEANDVRCTHAATVSRVDANQLFYLESRGIPRAEAEAMIVAGFLETTVGRLSDWGDLQRPVRLALSEALGGSESNNDDAER